MNAVVSPCPVLPRPSDAVEGYTVVASCWQSDEFGAEWATVLLLGWVAPYYIVADIHPNAYPKRTRWVVNQPSMQRFENITQAAEEYRQQTQ